ncbi:MAG: hypothetical protein ACI379_01710 [Nocardioides sp.]|uniref:hypothetical protein n=1 Tax=Nocardioides sp. TaxID=35761 RepID=UPI003EFC298F
MRGSTTRPRTPTPRTSPTLTPAAADRILDHALVGGARRRRRRHLVTATCSLAAAAVVATGAAVATLPTAPQERDDVATAPAAAPEPTAYDLGSATEVPEGPVVETSRAVAGDAALDATLRALLPAGTVEGLEVHHVESSDPSHMADKTRDGRRLDLTLDGRAVSVTIQRWDGYAAVGIDAEGLDAEDFQSGDLDPQQRAATTAREACGGSYQVFPAIECEQGDGGWYSVARPSQGAASPADAKELLVEFYSEDGYVVRVDSYNSAGEKLGQPLSSATPLDVQQSLALATSARWFTAG